MPEGLRCCLWLISMYEIWGVEKNLGLKRCWRVYFVVCGLCLCTISVECRGVDIIEDRTRWTGEFRRKSLTLLFDCLGKRAADRRVKGLLGLGVRRLTLGSGALHVENSNFNFLTTKKVLIS